MLPLIRHGGSTRRHTRSTRGSPRRCSTTRCRTKPLGSTPRLTIGVTTDADEQLAFPGFLDGPRQGNPGNAVCKHGLHGPDWTTLDGLPLGDDDRLVRDLRGLA